MADTLIYLHEQDVVCLYFAVLIVHLLRVTFSRSLVHNVCACLLALCDSLDVEILRRECRRTIAIEVMFR